MTRKTTQNTHLFSELTALRVVTELVPLRRKCGTSSAATYKDKQAKPLKQPKKCLIYGKYAKNQYIALRINPHQLATL